jgi:hypothetical protein
LRRGCRENVCISDDDLLHSATILVVLDDDLSLTTEICINWDYFSEVDRYGFVYVGTLMRSFSPALQRPQIRSTSALPRLGLMSGRYFVSVAAIACFACHAQADDTVNPRPPVQRSDAADAITVAPAQTAPLLGRPELSPDTPFADQLAAWTSYALALPMPDYAINDWPRTVPATGKLQCPDVAMVNYRGTTMNYGKSLRVYEGLVPHLAKMEEVMNRVALQFYGRTPRRVLTLGTLNCRRMRTYPTYISEHSFANAIDIEGFEFSAATKKQRTNIAKSLRGAQKITVLGDWDGGKGVKSIHQQFLQTLVIELLKEDVFRLYLGPVFPGHQNHFHFDMSNFRMVEI